MQKDIKITMLGATKRGKTCYMLAMYNLMREGINGFTLAHPGLDEDLALVEKWDKLESDHIWPEGTKRGGSVSYKFDFCFAYQPLVSFDWLDYGGSALTEAQTEEDVKLLTERLMESSCIFLSVSGGYFQGGSKIAREHKEILARMNVFIRDIAKQGKKPSIVILITKYDLCAHRPLDDILQDISRSFSPLFVEGGEWDVMVCPVTLGLDLAKDFENGNIDPQQVHLPLVFAIFQDYYASTLRKENEVNQWLQKLKNDQQILEAAKNSGFWTDLSDWWNSRDRKGSAETVVIKTKTELESLKNELSKHNSKLRLLVDQLKDQTGFLIYSNGKRQESADD